jgi:hypothetical protein
MNPTDHERYSERLSAYVRGTLGPDETEEIRAHLAACPQCRHEEAAVIALVSSPEEGLRPDESERLRLAVLAEITSEAPSLTVVPSTAASVQPRRSWAPRIAQFMAAAAVIAAAAIYLTSPGTGVIGGADSPESAVNELGDTEGGSRDRRAPDTDEAAGGSGTTVVDAEGQVTGDTAGAGGGDAGSAGANDSGTRSTNDAETTMEAAAAPTQDGADPQVAAFKEGKSKFGCAAGYRGQR